MRLAPTHHDHCDQRRLQSWPELFADGFVHTLGIVAGAAGATVLLILALNRAPPGTVAALGVYATCFMAMLACSAAYNMGYYSRWRGIFRRCDHCAIFLMIAGTYTPFTTQLLGFWQALWLTVAIWVTCLFGIVMKLAEPETFERWSVALYLGLGWVALVVFAPIFGDCSWLTVALLTAGGALYSIGVVFHAWERLPFQNAIWHVFVLAAAICHYWAVVDGIVLRPLQA